MKALQRLFLTACRTALVAEGDPLGATLYAAPGDEIPDSAAEKFGLVDGRLPDEKERKGPPPGNKEKNPDSDKGKGGDKPDDLSQLKGVGPATAEALAKAGIDSFAKLAGVDPASPPEVDAKIKDWADLVDQAKALAPPETEASAQTEPAPGGGLTINKLENAG